MNFLLTTPPLNVFEHMALDETLVRARHGEITLRLYNWAPGDAVTFGYAQSVNQVRASVQAQAFAREICRRPTGGGLVYHREDLTFSLIFPSQKRPAEIYQQFHGAMQAALVLSGISSTVFAQKLPAAAYAPSHHHTASACFTNPVENDLLQPNGQKMLGGAIRRFGDTVLYQGSLQIAHARQNPLCTHAIIQAVRGFLQTDFQAQRVDETLLQTARALAQTQYKTSAWTEKF